MNQKQLLSSILDLGEALLTSGAEVNRTEDTITRVCKAFGFVRCDVFTITSSIVLTVHTVSGDVLTQTRRIRAYTTDLERVNEINALSRAVCSGAYTPEQYQNKLSHILSAPHNPQWLTVLLYGVISAAFTVFFGGNAGDMICAFAGGITICAVWSLGVKIKMNSMVLLIACSAVGGFCALTLSKLGIGSCVDKIIIGNIMLLIPGLTLTSSLRDMISGDMISGLLEFCEALLKAAAIAIGFALVLIPFGG